MASPAIHGLLLAVIGCTPPVALGAESVDSTVAQRATAIDRLVRITYEPHPMEDATILLCRDPKELAHNLHEGYRVPAYCHVYVSPEAEAAIRAGKVDYPVDSLVVKTKFHKDEPDRIDLYTVMRKREAGYDPDNGDWEYSVIDGRTRRIEARGRIDSCIQCHTRYKETGYVTRAYWSQVSGQE